VAVVEAFEGGVLDLPDFHFTGDDYTYRFDPEAKQGFLDLLRERFNSGVRYKGRALKWDTVIEQKTIELGRFLVGRTGRLDFSEACPKLARADSRELRKRILSLRQQESQRLGIGKSTLHYLRKNANKAESFRVCRPDLRQDKGAVDYCTFLSGGKATGRWRAPTLSLPISRKVLLGVNQSSIQIKIGHRKDP
jgi:hypothetical protein